MTEAWKQALEPLADLLAAPLAYVWADERTDDELNALEAAAAKATQTNCWWATFAAAQLVKEELGRVREERIARAKREASA